MLDVRQFRELIIRPALDPLGLWSPAAENLIVGTAIQESGLHYLYQVGGGPAAGIYQIEPKTYNWLRERIFDHDLYGKILEVCNLDLLPVSPDCLIWHLRYATIVCRFRYLQVEDPLPDANDISKIAQYYKDFYNTGIGSATASQFIKNYNKYNQN